MTTFPHDIRFKYGWRKYQQRVLDELEEHLDDGHLHVIAPPGSGKTVLGLEVALRLNQPVLILAPTIAIRNQWIQRFCELFLQTNTPPPWISRDIRQPAFMTVATYQALHAACSNPATTEEEDNGTDEEETEENDNSKIIAANFDAIVNGLKAQNLKTVVADEAHHLKNEWWQTLTRVKEQLNPVIVGLTATPPYDVSVQEWQRYIALNGPVDTEISVPELVIEGDLCPHQDYVYFTFPTKQENQVITSFRQDTDRLFADIRQDETIISAVEKHPAWLDPAEQLDWIYTNIAYYSACLIFLHANGRTIPETHLSIIGDDKPAIPALDYEWTETLLDFYLYQEKEHFNAFEAHRRSLENRLKRYGAIERKKISFSHNKRVTGLLSSSISKLNGIREIADFEYRQLGKDLRMVILSDFIRKEFFTEAAVNTLELNKIGVIPIFETLRRTNTNGKKTGVLTGSVIIIPQTALDAFIATAGILGITKISYRPVPFDNNYILVDETEQLKHDIVYIITHIFQQGEIEILVGTKSLLGEGWDAPAINTLVLASFVGSFVLSNQMRGRAIRTQKGNEAKTGNIWHLACIDPTSPTGGDDFDLLQRRFRSFTGVSFREEPGIENGINRLNLPKDMYRKEVAEKINDSMLAMAGDRGSLGLLWEEALATGVNLVEEIKIPFPEASDYNGIKTMYLQKTIANLAATLVSGYMSFGLGSLQALGRTGRAIRSVQELYVALGIIGGLGILFFGRLTYKTIRLYLRYRDIAKDIRQIGNALLHSLTEAGIIHTHHSKLQVAATVDSMGAVHCHLEGGTTFEKSTFINTLQEVTGPIDNPRYVIVRKNRLLRFIKQKDYHTVPEILGRNKNLALHFKGQWQQQVGACDLVFTRTKEGRQLLLQARIKSLSTQLEDKTEHVNKWR